jgi:hypothetical protein
MLTLIPTHWQPLPVQRLESRHKSSLHKAIRRICTSYKMPVLRHNQTNRRAIPILYRISEVLLFRHRQLSGVFSPGLPLLLTRLCLPWCLINLTEGCMPAPRLLTGPIVLAMLLARSKTVYLLDRVEVMRSGVSGVGLSLEEANADWSVKFAAMIGRPKGKRSSKSPQL